MAIEEAVEELPTKFMALPFMDRLAALTGALAGDVGFDLLGLILEKGWHRRKTHQTLKIT